MKLSRILCTATVLAGLAFAPAAMHAVDINARIHGTVMDPGGAVIPGAVITATNEATGVKFTVVSGKDGSYVFQQLPVGTYDVAVNAPGFKAFKARGITLTVDQEYVEPVTLSIGGSSETITVDADAVQVNTTDMQLNHVVDAAQLEELPLISRAFTSLEQIEPGIQASSDRFGSYSANGSQTQQSSYLINGADTNDLPLNTVTFNPNLDAIDQFNLVTGPLNAEYDRNSGGIVSVTIKQGTNHIHGSVFEFYRDTFLNTSNYFQYVNPTYKINTAYHQNIFGGTIGAPIIKDKLFAFFAYQGTRQRVPGSGGNSAVFTDAQRTGNFSTSLSSTGNPLGYSFATNNTTTIPGTLTRLQTTTGNALCAPGNTWLPCLTSLGGVVPTAAFDPIAAKLLTQYVPHANSAGYQYVFQSVASAAPNQYIARVDFDPNSRNQITAVGIYQKGTTLSTIPFTGASLPGFGEMDTTSLYQYTADYVHQISNTVVNDLAAHYTRFNYQAVYPQTTAAPSSFGFSISPENTAAQTLPTISTGYFTLGFSTNGPQPRIDQTYQADDTVSVVLGHHQLKFGYDGRRFNVSNPFYANNSGSYGFASSGAYSSGDPGLDFLLGNSSSYAQGSGATIQAYAFLNYAFARDEWKVTKNFTFDYGLGYQIDTVLHNRQYGGEAISCLNPGKSSTVFTTAPVGIAYPGDPGCSDSGQSHTHFKDFGPRIGFAYAPDLGFLSGGEGKLSIRGGFGLYYNRSEEETSLNNLETPPFGLSSAGAADFGAQAPAFANPYQDIDSGTAYKNKFPYSFPTRGQTIDYSLYEPLDLNTYASSFRSPYAENFQLTVEREFPSKIIASVAYVGSLARHNQLAYEGSPETQAGHDACLADTTYCGSKKTQGYRIYQSYYFPTHTQYGAIDPNTGLPALVSFGTVGSGGASSYNSMQLSAHKGNTHGLEFQASYTYSHALDNGSSYENSGYGGSTRGYNQFNNQLNYGDSNFDARHRFVFSPLYIVPFRASGSAFSVKNLALSGWQISTISTVATGFPFDISYGGGSSNSLYCSPGFSFYACPDEPNQTGPLALANPRVKIGGANRTAFFTASASNITQAALGSFGNARRDKFHGPGINNTDMVIAKNVALAQEGKVHLQLRLSSSNVFNHTQFSQPASTPSTTAGGLLSLGSTGQITSAAAGRATQLGAKVYF